MPKPRVLCVAAPDWLGVSRLPGVLHAAGCRVSLLAHPRSYAALSRFVDELIPGTWDAAANVELLRVHLASGASYDWIILADDPTVSAAARRCGEGWTAPWFPVDAASQKPRWLAQKTAFNAAAAAAGLPVPVSRSASSPDEVRAAARAVGFPVIVKPAAGSAGSGVFFAASADGLERSLPDAGPFVVQRAVAGRSGGTCVLFDRGRPAWWLSSLRARVSPAPYGPATARALLHVPAIAGIAADLGALTGFHGLCELDWILPEDGSGPVIVEFNPRPPSYLFLVGALGADLPAAIRAFLAGEKAPAPGAPGPEGSAVGLYPEDLISALSARDWRRGAAWLSGAAGPLPQNDPALIRAFHWLAVKALARGALFQLPRSGH